MLPPGLSRAGSSSPADLEALRSSQKRQVPLVALQGRRWVIETVKEPPLLWVAGRPAVAI